MYYIFSSSRFWKRIPRKWKFSENTFKTNSWFN